MKMGNRQNGHLDRYRPQQVAPGVTERRASVFRPSAELITLYLKNNIFHDENNLDENYYFRDRKLWGVSVESDRETLACGHWTLVVDCCGL